MPLDCGPTGPSNRGCFNSFAGSALALMASAPAGQTTPMGRRATRPSLPPAHCTLRPTMLDSTHEFYNGFVINTGFKKKKIKSVKFLA